MAEVIANPAGTDGAVKTRVRRSQEQIRAEKAAKARAKLEAAQKELERIETGVATSGNHSRGGGNGSEYKDAVKVLNASINRMAANQALYPTQDAVVAQLQADIGTFGAAAIKYILETQPNPSAILLKWYGPKADSNGTQG